MHSHGIDKIRLNIALRAWGRQKVMWNEKTGQKPVYMLSIRDTDYAFDNGADLFITIEESIHK